MLCLFVCRFAAVRAGDKYRGAFEPVGEDISAAVDNLYTRLDKKSVHLATKVARHPEILVCVLRRSTAAKLLDVHAFVCDSQEQALTIADHLHWLHAWFVHVHNTGVGSRRKLGEQGDAVWGRVYTSSRGGV